MSSKSKMRKNPDTGLATVDRDRVERNHARKAERAAHKAARWARIMDPSQKGVNTPA